MLIYDNIKFEKSAIYNNPLYRIPNLVNLFKYSISFYTSLANKFFILVLQKLLIVRNDCWTLFIGKGDFLNSQLFRLKPLKLPKNEFWADPFLYKKDNQVYAIGGRVLNFVSISEEFNYAKENIINNLNRLNWNDGLYRKDIGHKVIK